MRFHLTFRSCIEYRQINGGRITLSCTRVNPKSIQETFKESLWGIFMQHLHPDPTVRRWQFLTRPHQSMDKLMKKCQLVLSYVMGTDAMKIQDPADMLSKLLTQCQTNFRESYFRRQTLGI